MLLRVLGDNSLISTKDIAKDAGHAYAEKTQNKSQVTDG